MGSRITELIDALPLFAKLVTTIGFPVLMCLFFVAKDVGWLPNPYMSMATEIHEHITHDTETATLLRLICEHTATSQYDRDLCAAAK